MAKTDAQQRKGRLYKQIILALSWHASVQIQVPEALWRALGYGWPYGPLLKSTTNIVDPDYPAVRWSAWWFGLNTIFIESSTNRGTYINLLTIAQEAREEPSASPTAGVS